MKVIPDSLLSCLERISSERYGLLNTLAAEGMFSPADLESIAEEFTIPTKVISLNTDIDARNVISRNYYAMFHAARAVIFHFQRYDEEKHEAVIKRIGGILGKSIQKQLWRWKEERTKVDYSPFPKFDLMDYANKAIKEAEEFLNECKTFLLKRGVSL